MIPDIITTETLTVSHENSTQSEKSEFSQSSRFQTFWSRDPFLFQGLFGGPRISKK